MDFHFLIAKGEEGILENVDFMRSNGSADLIPLCFISRLLIGQYVTLFGDVVSHVNISSVKAEDGGEYECIAENRAGKTSHSARLNIYGLPYVRPMSPISAVAGKDLVVKCPVAGYPIETVIWEKGIYL